MKIELVHPSGQTPEVHESRREPRYDGNGDSVALTADDGTNYTGSVVNESFGGVGIVFEQRVPLKSGRQLELNYHGIPTSAIVRHVTSFAKGGCLVGIHWKSNELARRTDQLKTLLCRTDLVLPDNLRRFIELIPGGIQLMWKLHEHGKWIELAESVDRLGRDASSGGVHGTEECIGILLQLLEEPNAEAIRTALDDVVSFFINRTTEVAEKFAC